MQPKTQREVLHVGELQISILAALIQDQQALAVQFKEASINILCDNGCQLWKTKFLENFKFVRFSNI